MLAARYCQVEKQQKKNYRIKDDPKTDMHEKKLV